MTQGLKIESWKVEKLSDVSKINYGYTEKASFKEVGPKFLRITDIQDNNVDWETVPFCKIDKSESPRYLLKNGDIVFARTGATTGKSFLIKNPPLAVFASYLIRLQILDISKLLPEYLILFFQTKTYWDNIAIGISGSAQGGFNASKLAELEIPIPPLPEQQRIVSMLDEAFESIASAKSNAEQNLVNARELFESVLKDAFENAHVGWKNMNLDEVVEDMHQGLNTAGYKIKFYDTGYPIIQSRNIERGVIDLDEKIKYMSKSDWELYKGKYRPKIGDVFFSNIGTIGKTAVITEDLDYLFHWNIYSFKINKNILDSFYLKYFLDHATNVGYFAGQQKGGTVSFVTKKMIARTKIKVPPLAEQRAIVARLEALSAETKRLEEIYQQKIESLEEMKKSVLAKAFAGEL